MGRDPGKEGFGVAGDRDHVGVAREFGVVPLSAGGSAPAPGCIDVAVPDQAVRTAEAGAEVP
jgi:hypothetical protein